MSDGTKTYQAPSFLKEAVMLREKDQQDPSQAVEGMPPNMGRYVIPQIETFQSFTTTVARTFRDYDEATKDSLDNARYMRNDCGLMESLEARHRGTALLNWHLEPEDDTSEEQTSCCAELTKILKRINRFTEYRRVLLEAIWYGKYAIQNRYAWDTVGGTSRCLPKPLWENPGWLPINGDKLVFRFDSDRNAARQWPYQLGIRVGAGYSVGGQVADRWKVEAVDRGMAYFPADWERKQIVLHKHMIEDGAYEDSLSAGMINGVGVRSRIYWDWVQKQESLAFLIEFLERSAGGIEIWKYPQGNAQAKAEVVKGAQRTQGAGRNTLIVPVPPEDDGMQYGVQIIEPGFQGIEVVQHLLTNYYGHRIKRYVLGQTLSSEAEATGLGSGVAELHLDTFLQIIKYDATNLEETLTNDLVTRVKDFNFPHAKHFRVRFVIETETQDAEKKLSAAKTAWEMGARIKENAVLDLVGIALPTDGEVVLPSPQQQQQQPPPGMGMQPGAAGFGEPPAAGKAQASVPADIHSELTDAIMRAGNQDLSGDQPSLYVAEGEEWVERGIPDPAEDTGDRHRVDQYSRGDNGKNAPRDEDGQFSKTVPVIVAEKLHFESRREAVSALRELRGTYKNLHKGWDIAVSMTGLRHSAFHRKANVSALMKLPEIIRNAVHFQSETAKGSDDVAAHELFAPVQVNAKTYLARLVVLESAHKMEVTQFRLHHLDAHETKKLAAQAGTGETNPKSSTREPVISIDQFRDVVNEFLSTPEDDGPEKYARKGKSASGQQEFAWITIGGHESGGKKHAGGTHVQVKQSTGEIVKGPDELEGKKVGELGARKDDQKNRDRDEGSHKNTVGAVAQPSSTASGEEATPNDETPPILTPGALFEDAIDDGDSPREAAVRAETADQSQYAYARESAIGNAGEDLKGSARHKVNAWKSLSQAEEDGTAVELVTRENLLRNEPHNLMDFAADHPLTAAAMHLALNRFPPKPGYGKRAGSPETQKKDRADYVATYRFLKTKAEEIADRVGDVDKALGQLKDAVGDHIRNLREGKNSRGKLDPANNTANSLIAMQKSLSSYFTKNANNVVGQMRQVSQHLLSLGDQDAVVSHATDLIEGRSTVAKMIGKSGSGKSRTGYVSPAEMYVATATRTGGKDVSKLTRDPNESTAHMVEHFGLRGMQWGNSVTDDERSHHAEKIVEAFTDLIDILGLRPEDASLGGKMGLAVGARGHAGASAHYEPSTNVINLTRKNGVGSLAHEWGHGFDHMLSDFRAYKSRDSQPGKDDHVGQAMSAVRKTWTTSGFGSRMNRALNDCINQREVSEGKREYWSSAIEVFARTFERYVARKLESKNRSNTYLSGLDKFSDHKMVELWPTDTEVDAMTPAFDALFESYRKSKGITEKYSRTDIARYFREQLDKAMSGGVA